VTKDDFEKDLSRWIDLQWDDVKKDWPALMAVGAIAQRIEPTDNEEEGPLYHFWIEGCCYCWGTDGWDVLDAERLLVKVGDELLCDRGHLLRLRERVRKVREAIARLPLADSREVREALDG
jgi:hypothetical protein